MVWFAGLMVNAILRRCAIVIKSSIAKVYGSFMAQTTADQLQMRDRFADRFDQREAVVDADFETVGEGPVSDLQPKQIEAEDRHVDRTGMSVFGKKPAKPQPDDSIAFYGFAVILVALSFWVSGGHSLFRNVDRITTSSVQAASSEIADASWRVVTGGGKSALHVEGIVKNSGKVAVHTKPVTVTVKHNDGSTKRYLLGQKGWTLGPGQEVVVSGRLDIASPSIASVVIALSN
jgi:hypothetical protein